MTADPNPLAEELEREQQEVLRLRKVLITRDAELGDALGRLAELETRSKRLTGVARKIAGGIRRSPS